MIGVVRAAGDIRGYSRRSHLGFLVGGAVLVVAAVPLAAVVYWPAGLALTAALAGGAAVAMLCRGIIRRQQLELDRLSLSVERRAEQVTALSHELRTPLSMIKGAADLLLEGSPGPVTRVQGQFLRSIAQQCNQVIGLCEGLLIQAKIESGLFEPQLEPTDVLVLARDVVVAMRPLCAQRRQRISLDTPQVCRTVPADPALLLQALTNLLSNASRFTSDGGSIGVRIREIDDGVAVYVSDDGDGMTREQRARLFRRFATGRPLADGTGLGLVITKDIVELHGGSIMVDTTARKGTTFVLTLPAGTGS